MAKFYTLEDVLTVASLHPFYHDDVLFPPSHDLINEALTNRASRDTRNLHDFPLCGKEHLYKVIRRLCADTDPRNFYRQSSSSSVTGGGSGGVPMVFLTDSVENRMQRAAAGLLMKTCGVVEPYDWIVSLHASGFLYRSLDLIAECMEVAGGTVFCSGHVQPLPDVVKCLAEYRVNVLSGDASQILNFAHYFSSLSLETRQSIKITKIIYTSESLLRSQREYIMSVFGAVRLCSVLASAESGPWAVMDISLTGEPTDDTADFIFDTRTMIVEILEPSEPDAKCDSKQGASEPAAEGTLGAIALTSLQRLRNPLVRYVTGDLGSLHQLPFLAQEKIPGNVAPHLRVLRLHGRDQRFSFEWQAGYFDFQMIHCFMQNAELGILQWQIVLKSGDRRLGHRLEVRILGKEEGKKTRLPDEVVVEKIQKFFFVTPFNAQLFEVIFVTDAEGFERSRTGNKVIKFVDRRDLE